LNDRLTGLGDSLREMDIELMRRLSPRVNVIPVIGKADSLTPSELRGFKKRVSIMNVDHGLSLITSPQIMEDIEHYDIPVYNFPYDVEEDDEETIQDNSELRVCNITHIITDYINLPIT
jgi:cell division control protein 11